MRKEFEEILEAAWKADEIGDTSYETIQRICPDKVPETDLKDLATKGFLTIESNNITLTQIGREKARGIVRRHRLAEVLFSTVLSLDAEKREEIACEVEHALLPEVEEAICTLLGHPTVCPNGKPISPGKCCDAGRTTATAVVINLTELQPGERARISYIKPKRHERLHRLSSFGLTPGTVIKLHQKFPAFDLKYEGTELAIDRDVAEDIFVAKID